MAEYNDTADILDKAKACWRKARDHQAKWRTQAREDFAFYAGDQWSQDDVRVLNEQGRPPIVFNRAAIYIRGICGYEVNNRQEIKYYPREMGDVRVSEILTSAAQWVYDNCDGEAEESDAFRDTVICGMGWTETRIDDKENPDYDIRVDRTDPLEMAWDPLAKKPNLADASWLIRAKRMKLKDAQDAFPDIEIDAIEADPWNSDQDNRDPDSADPQTFYRDDAFSPAREGEVTVIEYQYKEKVEKVQALNPMSGKIEVLDKEKFDELVKMLEASGQQPPQSAPRREWVHKQVFFVGDQIASQSDCPDPKSFTYRCITGERNSKENTWFGVMAALRDPQRWSNKWLSQILHIMNSNAKGGLLAERSAFEDQNQAEESWSNPQAITWAADGALSAKKIQPKQVAQLPPALPDLLKYANESFGEVSGVNAEILGLVDRDQPGVLEYQRKQSAVTLLAPLFDALRRYRKMQGRTLMYMIQNYISDGRLIRIVGDGHEQYIPLVKDQTAGEFDVIVDQSASAPNMKEQTWGVLQALLPALAKTPFLSPPVLLEFLKYSPLPDSLTQKLQEMAQQAAQQPPPPDPKVEAMKAKLQIDAQKAELDMTLQQREFEMDAAMQQQEMQFKAQEHQMDLAMQQEKHVMDAQMAQDQHMRDAAMAQDRASLEGDIAREKASVANQTTAMKATQGGAKAGGKPGNTTINVNAPMQKPALQPSAGEQLAQAITSGMSALLQQNAEAMGAVVGELRGIAAQMSAPKRLIRDEEGRAMGVETVLN